MNIKSNEYQLTKKRLFQTYMDINLKRLGIFAFIYVILFGAAVFFRLLNIYWFIFVIVFFAVFLPFLLILSILFYINSKANKIFYKKKRFEIDDDFITTYAEDGSLGKNKLDSIIKVVGTRKYYMLQISQAMFLYLPKSAFLSQEDINRFESLLRSKKLLKNKS